MESMALHLESGYERLYRWTQSKAYCLFVSSLYRWTQSKAYCLLVWSLYRWTQSKAYCLFVSSFLTLVDKHLIHQRFSVTVDFESDASCENGKSVEIIRVQLQWYLHEQFFIISIWEQYSPINMQNFSCICKLIQFCLCEESLITDRVGYSAKYEFMKTKLC